MNLAIIPPTVHGVIDYAWAGTLPFLARYVEDCRARQMLDVSAALTVGYSSLTDYPGGEFKLLPFRVHLAMDAFNAGVLGGYGALAPKMDRTSRATLVALGVLGLLVTVLSQPKSRRVRPIAPAPVARQDSPEMVKVWQ
jgi:hypothetical protein